MIKSLLLLAVSFLLWSCFYKSVEKQSFYGIIDGKRNDVEKYDLVYLFNGDTASVLSLKFFYNSAFERNDNGHIKIFGNGYCNVFFRDSFMGCPNSLQGIVDVEVYLKNIKSGNSYLLAKKTVDMGAYRRAEMITQVYIGSDTAGYEARTEDNIEWNRVKPLVLKADNDTIYHYTVKYWEKRDDDNYVGWDIDEKYFVEVP